MTEGLSKNNREAKILTLFLKDTHLNAECVHPSITPKSNKGCSSGIIFANGTLGLDPFTRGHKIARGGKRQIKPGCDWLPYTKCFLRSMGPLHYTAFMLLEMMHQQKNSLETWIENHNSEILIILIDRKT